MDGHNMESGPDKQGGVQKRLEDIQQVSKFSQDVYYNIDNGYTESYCYSTRTSDSYQGGRPPTSHLANTT